MQASSVPSLHWYQVVLSSGLPVGPDLRARVQASNVDAALRQVMRVNRIAFTPEASIWLLGRSGAPARRVNVRCRLPHQAPVQGRRCV